MKFDQLKRRDFITLLGGAAVAWPLATRAQQAGRTYRLAVLMNAGRETLPAIVLFDELRRSGFIEGQNLTVVGDGFGLSNEQFAERASSIVRAAPDVIVTAGDLATRAVQAFSRTIPIVATTEDMVAAGLVTSLARPGGNITGLSFLSPGLDGKRQDLLMEVLPNARRIAALADSTLTPARHLQTLQDAARGRGVELSVYGVAKPDEIVPAINKAKASGIEGLNVLATPLFYVNSRTVIEGVSAVRLPAVYQWPEMAEEGGLAGYGPRITQLFHQRAQLVIKVLRGAKPVDIPVEQPTTFELVINLQAAKAIGYEVPAGLVLRADKVIE